MFGLVLAAVAVVAFLYGCYRMGPAAWGIILILVTALVGALYRSCAMQ